MKKILIIAIMVLMPVTASAATIVPGLKGGDPGVGRSFNGTYDRLYALEIAVAELQDQNAALQSKINLLQAQGGVQTTATGNTSSLEARVSALENVTKAIQQSLVFVIQLLTDAINKASGK